MKVKVFDTALEGRGHGIGSFILEDLVKDIVNNYDHVRKVDLVATAKESSNDED